MLNGEPALRRRHSGNTFSPTGHSATHSHACTFECTGVSAATETTGEEPAGTEATATETDGVKKICFWNDPCPVGRPNHTTP